MLPDPNNVPAELKALDQWIVWKWVTREGKRTKPPFDANTGRPGDATDPTIWLSFERAIEVAAQNGYDGIGFAVTISSPYSGLDLDGCIDESGNLAPWAEAIVQRFASCTEITPSERGLRIWVKGKLPPGKRRRGQIELYDSGRYFTVTGQLWPGTPTEIAERGEELAAFHAELFPQEASKGTAKPTAPLALSDEEIIRKAEGAKGGETFRALMAGDTSAFGGDDSAADLSLCSRLAFWFGGDQAAIDRIFRTSGLYREKWDRKDYRERTIKKAIDGQRAFYDPGYGGERAPGPNGQVAAGPKEKLDDPHRLARIFLKRHIKHDDGPTLVYWNEEWHRWDGTCFHVVPEKEVRAKLNAAIKTEFDRIALKKDSKAIPVLSGTVSNALDALKGMVLLELKTVPRQPAWVGKMEPGEDWPDPREVLPATNALIHLPSFVIGEPSLLRPTPRFFSPTCLGYAFDAAAQPPAEWLGFLDSIWPDDPEAVATLQEWMGYCLVPDTALQKILMLIGPKRSGKGTITRILRAMVGPDNVAAPTLSGLATNFGLAPLIGKTVAIIADARLSGRADAQVIVERLLSISGEDAQTIDRKHLSGWTGSLLSRFMLVSNELPRLGDSSGALPSRMVVLHMSRSFYGKEDTLLTQRLLRERPSILLWAIEGWARLRERGYFVQPESGKELLAELGELSSPIGTFVEERCRTGPECQVSVKDLFGAWKTWCDENGKERPGDSAGFGRSLRAHLPRLRVVRRGSGQEREREYLGVELRAHF